MVCSSSSVCVVGSFSLDSIRLPGRDLFFHSLGGAVAFTSFAVRALEESVSVVSRVGGDFPEVYLWQLRERGIDVSIVKRYMQETTTRFELCYNDFSERMLKLVCKGCSIRFDDIPKSLHAKVIHVAPIADEISYDIMEYLASCCDVLSLDPQGFLRQFDANGHMTLTLSIDKRVLELVNVCKVSLDELFVLTGLYDVKAALRMVHDVGVETVIVTMGAKGSLLSVEDDCYSIPVCQPSMLVDPTGAGDVFIGAFLAEYLKGGNFLWCASVGSAAASFAVESLGSSYKGTKNQIYQRAQGICENEVKV